MNDCPSLALVLWIDHNHLTISLNHIIEPYRWSISSGMGWTNWLCTKSSHLYTSILSVDTLCERSCPIELWASHLVPNFSTPIRMGHLHYISKINAKTKTNLWLTLSDHPTNISLDLFTVMTDNVPWSLMHHPLTKFVLFTLLMYCKEKDK